MQRSGTRYLTFVVTNPCETRCTPRPCVEKEIRCCLNEKTAGVFQHSAHRGTGVHRDFLLSGSIYQARNIIFGNSIKSKQYE